MTTARQAAHANRTGTVASRIDFKEATVIASIIANILLGLGFGAEHKRADGNRAANFSGREALVVCEERVEQYIHHMENDH